MEIGAWEAEPIWAEFLRKLTHRGLRGVKLVVSDAHEGLKAAVTKVLSATWHGTAPGTASVRCFNRSPRAAITHPLHHGKLCTARC